MRKHLLGFALLLLTGPLMIGSLRADVVQLVDNHPDRHVVVKGDTLWDISSMFLKSPWLWPKVWSVNPQIDNPHLIYPGDVIYLVWINGQPQLRMDRGPKRLGPQIRRTPLEQAIPTIPLQDIKSFLSDNLVLQKDELEKAPYVLAGVNKRIISGAGDKIYARGKLTDAEQSYYGIYRPARIYKDPDTEEVLGYESKAIGGGYLVSTKDDILSLNLKRTNEEVRVKDRVLPTREEAIQSVFYPRSPEQQINGKILSVLRGVTQIGQFDVVAINRGDREGVKTGHVFHVYSRGEVVKDPVTQELVTLPSERAGTIMVFKVFDKVSYALVMRAENVMAVLDEIRTPN